jgi:DegV family protein with EDD domain
MEIEHFDGHALRRAVVAGADWVRHTRDHLNKINVFPVPDGDTGTNMALSLSATASAVRHVDEPHLGVVAGQVAEASILGAKGNSGLILAHWFLGLSKAVGKRTRLTSTELAHALVHATESVYHALEEPVEGTILTVMRAGSDAARMSAESGAGILHQIDALLEAAQSTLQKTPDMLRALREAHVVDAGAQGWVNFLTGMKNALSGETEPSFAEDDPDDAAAHVPVDLKELEHRFCTEVVVRGRHFDAATLRRRFHRFGSSLLIATTDDVFKLHVHTDHPDEVLKAAAKLGTVEERKVDDMLQQSQEQRDPSRSFGVPRPRQLVDRVAVVCDSAGDVPDALCEELGIERVPLQILFGDEVFRDQVDLRIEEFYARLFTGDVFPTTSQPPPRAFIEAFERIHPERETLVCTISGVLSGTNRSAVSASRLAAQPRLEVFDSGSASLGQGLLTVGAARLAAQGASLESILHWLRIWRGETRLLFTVSTLKYLRRGGRIGLMRGVLGDLLGMRPILSFRDGAILPIDKVRGDHRATERVLEIVFDEVPAGSRLRLGLVHTTEPTAVDRAREMLASRYDVVEIIHTPVTGVVGAHAGPGAWGVFYQTVRDDDPLAPARAPAAVQSM